MTGSNSKRVFIVGHMPGSDLSATKKNPGCSGVEISESHKRILAPPGWNFAHCYTSGHAIAVDTARFLSMGMPTLNITQLTPFGGINWEDVHEPATNDNIPRYRSLISEEVDEAVRTISACAGRLKDGQNALIVTHPVLADAMLSKLFDVWPRSIGNVLKTVTMVTFTGNKLVGDATQLC